MKVTATTAKQQNQRRAIANRHSKTKNKGGEASGFVDNRPGTKALKSLQMLIYGPPHMSEPRQRKSIYAEGTAKANMGHERKGAEGLAKSSKFINLYDPTPLSHGESAANPAVRHQDTTGNKHQYANIKHETNEKSGRQEKHYLRPQGGTSDHFHTIAKNYSLRPPQDFDVNTDPPKKSSANSPAQFTTPQGGIQRTIDPVRIQQLSDLGTFTRALEAHETQFRMERYPQRVFLAFNNIAGFTSEVVMFNWVCGSGDRNGVPEHLIGKGHTGGRPGERGEIP